VLQLAQQTPIKTSYAGFSIIKISSLNRVKTENKKVRAMQLEHRK